MAGISVLAGQRRGKSSPHRALVTMSIEEEEHREAEKGRYET